MSLWDILPEDLQLKILNEKIDININESEKLRQDQEDKRIDEYHNQQKQQLIEDISNGYINSLGEKYAYDEYDSEKEDNYEGYDAGIECGWESETEYEEESDTE
jgi:hypothetical protein